MSFYTFLILIAVALIVLLVRRSALLSVKDAARFLQAGGVIVDVRTPEEFLQSHVPNAINLPLSGLSNSVLDRFPNRDQVLLLHCLGGGRSAVGQRLLRAQGYARTYNLGSYRRAQRVLSECGKAPEGSLKT